MAESHSEPDATDAPAQSPQDLVEDVLREAQALLDTPDSSGSDDPSAAVASTAAETGDPVDPSQTAETGGSVDVEGLVARVDSLLGDLGHLVEDVESAEDAGAGAGLDLTLVLPTPPSEPEDIVPDHGPAGPQVDLFAAPPAPEPASEATTPSAPVTLETETPAEATSPAPASSEGAMLDDLASALAEEFDQPTLAPASDVDAETGSEASSEAGSEAAAETEAEAATTISPREAEMEDALLEAMAEEFGQEPAELPPVEDEGDPFAASSASSAEPSEAARRLEALLADRLAEEFELVEQAGTTTPTVIESQAEETPTPAQPEILPDSPELAQSDIDAVARAEMEALEALGSNLGTDLETSSTPTPSETTAEGTPERPVDSDTETFAPAEPPEATATAPVTETEAAETSPSPAEPVAVSESEVEAEAVSTADTPSESARDASEPTPEPETNADPTDDADVTTDRPRPTRTGPSTLVRLGAAPFRFIPRGLHRHATPVALSLVAWVPLAWGFALLAPTPEPATIDVLRAGFETGAETGHGEHGEGVPIGEDSVASASEGAIDADHAEP